MLHVKTFSFNLLQENTYVVYDDTNECVIIDCGAYYQEERQALVNFINDHQLRGARCVGKLYQRASAKARTFAMYPWPFRP